MTTVSKLQRMENLIAEFRISREPQRETRLSAMRDFLSRFETTHRRIWRTRVDFNLFSLLGVRTDDIRHSGVLAWFLAAESGHSQGVLFMRAFADLCGLDLPATALDRYDVQTECVGMESIIDLMTFRVFLENKILALEGVNQVDREFRDMRRQGAALGVPKEERWPAGTFRAGERYPTAALPKPSPSICGRSRTAWRTPRSGAVCPLSPSSRSCSVRRA